MKTGKRSQPWSRAFCGLILALQPTVSGASADGLAGVVVEDVAPYSAAARAGLEPGDRILSWSRAVAPGSEEAQGVISTPFDLVELELEQVPRAPLSLDGRRAGGAEARWTVAEPLGLGVRPAFEGARLAEYETGRELVRAGKAADGAARWRAAAGEARSRGQRLEAAWLLGAAARTLAEARVWAESDQVHQEALDALGSDHPRAEAQLLRQWAAVLHQRADRRVAERYLRVRRLDEASGTPSLALSKTLHMQAITARRDGDYATANELDTRALAIREALAPGSRAVALSLLNLGTTAWRLGQLSDAEGHYRRALDIERRLAPKSVEQAALLNNLALVQALRGELAVAEDNFRRSLAMKEDLGAKGETLAGAFLNLGGIAMERGDLAAAEETQRRALAIAESLGPESLPVAAASQNLGQIAAARDDLAAAQRHHERALAIKQKLVPDSLQTAMGFDSLGHIAHKRGDREAALGYQQRAFEIRERLAPGGYDTASSLFYLGKLAQEAGDLDKAEGYFRRTLAIRERLTPHSQHLATVLHRLGTLNLNRPQAALELFLRALDTLEAQRGKLGGTEEVQLGFAARYGRLYHDAVRVLVDLGRPADAVHVLERYRARSLLAMLAERDLRFEADLPEELARERRRVDAEYDGVQARLATLSPEKAAAEVERLVARLRELRRGQEEIAGRIRQASPRYASLQYPEPLALDGVRQALDPGSVLLAYSVGENETVLLAVESPDARGSGVSAFLLPVGGAALRAKVEAFRANVQSARPWDRAALDRQAADLYDLLVRPAEARLDSAARILISPDASLHLLPFAALRRTVPRQRARYLVEWKPLHVVPSATVYAELRKARRQAPAPGHLAAFGDPFYAAAPSAADRDGSPVLRELVRSFTLSPLPATRGEVEGIVRRFSGRSRSYLGAEATEERAKALGREMRYVHFACHGHLDERLPLNSGLALTIPSADAVGSENGLLQAWEIFDHVRLDADLVTLSACNTALGRDMGGEGLQGLTRAFLYAGARSVLASLWAVSDTSTARFMDRFYAGLAAGRSRDEALRAAQLELIGSRDLSHPFRWAAFQLSGDWR